MACSAYAGIRRPGRRHHCREGPAACIQCKFYNGTVGNKAVQEAYAAAAFQDAPYAVVVTNSVFTKSAHQLAHKKGVLLMHHTDLPRLELIVSSGAGPTDIRFHSVARNFEEIVDRQLRRIGRLRLRLLLGLRQVLSTWREVGAAGADIAITSATSAYQGNTGRIAPGSEGAIAGSSVLTGGKTMTAELEVVVDRSVSGEKLLGLPD